MKIARVLRVLYRHESTLPPVFSKIGQFKVLFYVNNKIAKVYEIHMSAESGFGISELEKIKLRDNAKFR